jgi:hypothetical protein
MSGQQGGGPDESLPPDPISVLAAAASQLHELFRAYVASGFTEAQALQIVISVLTVSLGGGS